MNVIEIDIHVCRNVQFRMNICYNHSTCTQGMKALQQRKWQYLHRESFKETNTSLITDESKIVYV